MIQGIVLKNNMVLIVSEIVKSIQEDYGGPDLDVSNPHIVEVKHEDTPALKHIVIKPFLVDCTDQKVFSFRSDDVLTMFSPSLDLSEKYKSILGLNEQLELDVDTVEDDIEEEDEN
jgi:hypothetical protein